MIPSPPADDLLSRKLTELRKLHAIALLAHDFEAAADVRASIERLEPRA
jgi:hypothetical protein